MSGYSILRLKKIKTLADLKRLSGHHERVEGADIPNAVKTDGEYDSKNFLGSGNMVKDVEERLPAKRRSDAVLAIEFMLTTSPESQRIGDDKNGELDNKKVARFKAAAKDFLEKEFGGAVTARIHMDERTPHIQGFIVPNEGYVSGATLNAKKLFNPKSIAQFQTKWHAACVAAGLEVSRGQISSQATHESIQDYYGRVNSPILPLPSLAPKPSPATATEIIKEKMGIETEHSKAQSLRERSENERALFAENHYEDVSALKKELEARARKAEDRATRAEAKLAVLKAQASTLRALPLAHVLRDLGCVQHKDQKLRWKTPAGDVWIEKSDGARFNSFDGSDLKGRGAIDLVMKINGSSFADATAWLASQHGHEATASDAAGFLVERASNEVRKAVQQAPEASMLPTPRPDRLRRVFDYLAETRRIPAVMVQRFVDAGRIYADKFANAVFVTDDGKGCEIRGSGKEPFHGQRGPKAGFTVEGDEKRVILVESAIEALSCRAMTGMTAISLGGENKARAIEIAKYWKERGAKIHAGHNNDPDGEKQAEGLIRSVPEIIRLKPRYDKKDWNDALKIHRSDDYDNPGDLNELFRSFSRRI